MAILLQLLDRAAARSSTTALNADVVVVGAGYAGLSAARDLAAAGLSVQVFEANGRVGGRTLTDDLGDVAVEVGGQYLAKPKEQPHAWRLIHEELGFDILPSLNPDSQGMVFFSSAHPDGLRVKGVSGAFSALGVVQEAETLAAMERLKQLQMHLPSGRERLDAMSFEAWLQEQWLGTDAKQLLRLLLSLTEEATESSEVSALGITGSQAQIEDAQTYIVRGGLQAPTLAMAAALGDRLHLSSPVTHIAQDDHGVLVTASPAAEGGRSLAVRARHVLFSGAPSTTMAVHFSPPLPSGKRQLFERLRMGNAVKVQLVYSRPFWREQGLSGVFNLVDLHDSPGICIDNSYAGSSLGIMYCMASGTFSKKLMSMSKEERQDLIVGFLAVPLGEAARRPLHYSDHDWAAEPYIGGGYNSVWPPGVLTGWGQFLTQDFGNVSWIGTDMVFPPVDFVTSYVEGAIKTGRDAARRLIEESSRPAAQAIQVIYA